MKTPLISILGRLGRYAVPGAAGMLVSSAMAANTYDVVASPSSLYSASSSVCSTVFLAQTSQAPDGASVPMPDFVADFRVDHTLTLTFSAGGMPVCIAPPVGNIQTYFSYNLSTGDFVYDQSCGVFSLASYTFENGAGTLPSLMLTSGYLSALGDVRLALQGTLSGAFSFTKLTVVLNLDSDWMDAIDKLLNNGSVYFMSQYPDTVIPDADWVSVGAVPEPRTCAMLGIGAVGLMFARRRFAGR